MSTDIKRPINTSDYPKIWKIVTAGNHALMRSDFANTERFASEAWRLLNNGKHESIQATILRVVIALQLSAVMDDREEAKANYNSACQNLGVLRFEVRDPDDYFFNPSHDETPVSYAADLFKGLLYCLQIYHFRLRKNDAELVEEVCELINNIFIKCPNLIRDSRHPEIIATILQIAIILDELIHKLNFTSYYKQLLSSTIKSCLNSIKDLICIDPKHYAQLAHFYSLMLYTLDPESSSYIVDKQFYADKALETYQHLSKLNANSDSQRRNNELFAGKCFYLAQHFDLKTAIAFIKCAISFLQGYDHATPASSKVLQEMTEWLNKQSSNADPGVLREIEALQAKWTEYEIKKKLEAEKELQEKRKQQSEMLSGLQFEPPQTQSPPPKEVTAIEMGSLFPLPSSRKIVNEKIAAANLATSQEQPPHPKKEDVELTPPKRVRN